MARMNRAMTRCSLILLLLLPVTLSAQFSETHMKKGKFSVGAVGGIQFTNIRNFPTLFNYEANGGIGFSAGALVSYYVSNSFILSAGLAYDNRKFNFNTSNTVYILDSEDSLVKSYLYQYDVDYGLNYLTIPLGIAFEKGSEKFRIKVQVNFYYSIYLNARMDGNEIFYFDPAQGIDLSGTILNQGYNEFSLSGSTAGIAVTNYDSDRTVEQNVTPFSSSDAGFNIMLGAAYTLTSRLDLFIDLGFTYSIGSLFENPEIDSRWTQITRINLGISYQLGGK